MALGSPLERAAALAAHRVLARHRAPDNLVGEATMPASLTARLLPAEKRAFDGTKRELEALFERSVTQNEVIRWLLAYAAEDRAAFHDAVRRAVDAQLAAARQP